jgi:hypothetical protein
MFLFLAKMKKQKRNHQENARVLKVLQIVFAWFQSSHVEQSVFVLFDIHLARQ